MTAVCNRLVCSGGVAGAMVNRTGESRGAADSVRVAARAGVTWTQEPPEGGYAGAGTWFPVTSEAATSVAKHHSRTRVNPDQVPRRTGAHTTPTVPPRGPLELGPRTRRMQRITCVQCIGNGSKTSMHIRCACGFFGQVVHQKGLCTSDVHGASSDN